MTYGLPEKTIERLSKYRRCLQVLIDNKTSFVYSHDLAKMLNVTPVQVRRDIMLIGHSGTLRRGYDVRKLNDLIGKIIESKDNINIAIVGLGNLGKAVMQYIQGKSSKLHVEAAFDTNIDKVDKLFNGVQCYNITDLQENVSKHKITLAIISTPAEVAQDVAEKLVVAGVKGILNYTTRPLNIPKNVFLEEYDMITSLEKIAYFIKSK